MCVRVFFLLNCNLHTIKYAILSFIAKMKFDLYINLTTTQIRIWNISSTPWEYLMLLPCQYPWNATAILMPIIFACFWVSHIWISHTGFSLYLGLCLLSIISQRFIHFITFSTFSLLCRIPLYEKAQFIDLFCCWYTLACFRVWRYCE